MVDGWRLTVALQERQWRLHLPVTQPFSNREVGALPLGAQDRLRAPVSGLDGSRRETQQLWFPLADLRKHLGNGCVKEGNSVLPFSII